MDLQDPLTVVAVTVGALLLSRLVFMLIVGGGSLARYFQGQGIALRYLRDKEFEGRVNDVLKPPPKPVKASPEPVLLLALLQREGRLLDFLLEDIQTYANDQIGAAVRDIHRDCQKALKEHLTLEPVIPGKNEGENVEVKPGFDPAAIRLTGNVTGQPPFKGTLQHHGWRVTEVKLQKPAEGQDGFVMQPAEVELP